MPVSAGRLGLGPPTLLTPSCSCCNDEYTPAPLLLLVWTALLPPWIDVCVPSDPAQDIIIIIIIKASNTWQRSAQTAAASKRSLVYGYLTLSPPTTSLPCRLHDPHARLCSTTSITLSHNIRYLLSSPSAVQLINMGPAALQQTFYHNYVHITQPDAKFVPNCNVSFAWLCW